MWYTYILKCSDKTLYTGVTNDIGRRLAEHNSSVLGARYTKSRRPVKLVYINVMKNRASAQAEEHRIKKLSRKEKFKLIKSTSNKILMFK